MNINIKQKTKNYFTKNKNLIEKQLIHIKDKLNAKNLFIQKVEQKNK